ncbi:MAG: hypothetical protein QOH84_4024 [Kribbellaceae bacterium]|nr:hypothetical protein [Kribbellaceae bacterium]
MRLYRPATVLVGILFVLLGGLTRLAEPDHVYDNESNRTVEHGTIGVPLHYGQSTVKVDRLKFARAYLSSESDEKAVETSGIYAVVEYDTVRGTEEVPNTQLQLATDAGTAYAPISDTYGSSLDFAAPGFGVTGAVVFEVNPADLAGLTLKVRSSPLFTVLTQDLAVDLAVPDEEIAQRLVDQAAPEYLIPHPVTRVAS